MPSATFLRTFLRTRWAAELLGAFAMLTFSLQCRTAITSYPRSPLRGPLRVRAFVRVR